MALLKNCIAQNTPIFHALFTVAFLHQFTQEIFWALGKIFRDFHRNLSVHNILNFGENC